MRRAFLSYSTDDDGFVEDVAHRLGRPRTHVDYQSFRPGEDFREEIRRNLDDTDVFVFFVSEASLASSWCRFELDEAEMRTMRGSLRKSIAIFRDGRPEPGSLPTWLARVRAIHAISPEQAARTIESLLLGATQDPQRPFIGRNEDLQRGVRKLAASEPLPRLIIATGLEGVGRRSYLRHLVSVGLNLELAPMIVLPSTGTLEDLFFESLSSSVLLDRTDAECQLEKFRGLTSEAQAKEVANQLAFLAQLGNAPCIVDKGAMLDGEGKYLQSFAEVLSSFLDHPNVYLSLVHTRSPQFKELPIRSLILERRLRMLAPPDAQALLARLLRDISVSVTAEQTARLAEGIGGYPPAAYFLASQVEDYGVELILGDAAHIQDFNTGAFSRFVRDLKLGEIEHETLLYLASETHLSLAGLASATGRSIQDISDTLRQLVDLSIVEVVEDEYTVTPPIQMTVLRTEKGLSRSWYEKAYRRLEAEYWSRDTSLPPISVVDATLRAGLRIGHHATDGYKSLVRPSLLINAAEELYHQREYRQALEYIRRAETMGGLTAPLLEIKVKACAQLERFGDARKALTQINDLGERRACYLAGFIGRKEGRHDRACTKFQEGYARGDRSTSLLRDYADSLLNIGAIQEARTIVGEASGRVKGNIYLLDLVARIEIQDGSIEDAEAALGALEVADLDQRMILYRRAAFLLARKGNAEAVRQAVDLAERAVLRPDAPLQAQFVLGSALIAAKKWDRWDKLQAELEKRVPRAKRNAILRLEVEAALRREDWRTAERLLDTANADAWVRRQSIRILDYKAADHTVMLTDRETAKTEAGYLRETHESTAKLLASDSFETYE